MDDKTRWNERYREGAYSDRLWPSVFLKETVNVFLNSSETSGSSAGKAIDLACGAGRNSIFLAKQGFETKAVDISAAGIALGAFNAINQGVQVEWICKNLLGPKNDESDALEDPLATLGQFQLITLFRFVAPGLLSVIMDHLVLGGHLIVEEHLRHSYDEAIVGPVNQAFRVESGDLLREVQSSKVAFEVREDFSGLIAEPNGDQAAVARLWVRRTG
jgi:SAM-dependent methyltransferase